MDWIHLAWEGLQEKETKMKEYAAFIAYMALWQGGISNPRQSEDAQCLFKKILL
jgi:hypothetical protein